jgi:hypothetical protein
MVYLNSRFYSLFRDIHSVLGIFSKEIHEGLLGVMMIVIVLDKTHQKSELFLRFN